MPKLPSLISGANGKPKLVTVGRQSACSKCGVELPKGVTCADIPVVARAFRSPKRYCLDCLGAILGQTRKDLDELQDQLRTACAR